MSDIDVIIKGFKEKILDGSITPKAVFDEYITFGTPYIFAKTPTLYLQLKQAIAKKFRVHQTEVIMIGSAKLGFSIAPYKLWREIQDESDIDMVIISEKLFDKFWKELLHFNIKMIPRSEEEDRMCREFLEYFFKGWLRADKFPFEFLGRRDWNDFFKSISYSKYDGRKVTGAIFRSMYFFEYYHILNILNMKQILGGVK